MRMPKFEVIVHEAEHDTDGSNIVRVEIPADTRGAGLEAMRIVISDAELKFATPELIAAVVADRISITVQALVREKMRMELGIEELPSAE